MTNWFKFVHIFVILCVCWDTQSDNTGFWQLLNVSSVIIVETVGMEVEITVKTNLGNTILNLRWIESLIVYSEMNCYFLLVSWL